MALFKYVGRIGVNIYVIPNTFTKIIGFSPRTLLVPGTTIIIMMDLSITQRTKEMVGAQMIYKNTENLHYFRGPNGPKKKLRHTQEENV